MFAPAQLLSADYIGSDYNTLSEILSFLKLGDYAALECVSKGCLNLVRRVLSGTQQLPELTIVEHVDDSHQVSKFFENYGVALCNDHMLRWLGKRFPSLTHVNLCGWYNITVEGLEAFARGCCKLKQLDMSAEYRSPIKHIDSLVDVVARNCPDLELVYLKNSETMSDNAIISLGVNCPKLTTLVLFYCYVLGDPGMATIYENCPNITILDVSHLDNITDELFQKMILKWRKLERLYVIGCSNVTDLAFDIFQNGSPNLKLIDLSYTFEKMSGRALLNMARGCPALEVLNLCNCKTVTDVILKEFIDRCHNIHTVNLGDGEFDREPNVTDEGIGYIARHCHNLTDYDLSGCKVRASTVEAMGVLPNLRRFVIFGNQLQKEGFLRIATNFTGLVELRMRDGSIDTMVFFNILSQCPRLRTLKLTSFQVRMNDEYTEYRPLAHSLSIVTFEYCNFFDDRSLSMLASLCPHISQLNMIHSMGFGDPTVISVATTTRSSLRSLVINGCHGNLPVTDASLIAVSEHCPYLQRMEICGTKITDVGLKRIAKSCKRIEVLDVSCCAGVSMYAVIFLSQNLKHMSKLSIGNCGSCTYCLANIPKHLMHNRLPLRRLTLPKR